MVSTLLALDLATRTGYALWTPGMDKPRAGIVDLPKHAGRGRWLRELYEWARPFCIDNQITHIGVEKPIAAMGNEDKIFMLISALGVMEMIGDEMQADVRPIANSSMFVHWVGPVHEEDRKIKDWRKSYSVAAAKLRGWNVTDHNVADALGVLTYLTWLLEIKTPWDNRKAAGNLFARQPGVHIDKGNERAATVLVSKVLSFNADGSKM